MDLLAYFRVLRRRWLLILVLVIAGGTLGAASALAIGEGDTAASKHYKATHTLVFQASTNDVSSDGNSGTTGSARPAFANLEQVAILVTSGDVPTKVAKELGMEPHQVTERVTTESDTTSNTLTITGIETNEKRAENLADTVAQQTIATLNEKEQSRFDKVSRDTITRLDTLRRDIDALDARIGGPGSSDVDRAERDGLVDQYRLAFERFQQLASQGAPTGGLSTLETASAVPISTSAYNTLFDRAQLGENHKRAEAQPSEDGASGSASAPSFDSPIARGLLGAFIGLLVGIGIALVAERFDRRLRTREDVAAAFALPVLAEVPRITSQQRRDKDITVQTAPMSGAAEAYRAVRSSLLFQSSHVDRSRDDTEGGNGARGSGGSRRHQALVVMVASAEPGDGKTTTSANLAAAFAETGSSVLVVNCDFRRPMAHIYLRAGNRPRRTLRTAIPGVWFVSRAVGVRDANPSQEIAAQRKVIATARDHFDVIVLDTAPLLTANDAVEIVPSADLVLLVARFQSTTSDRAQRAMELLHRVEASAAGVVVIGTPEDAGTYYYYKYRDYRSHDTTRAGTGRERSRRSTDRVEASDGLFAGSAGEPGSGD